MSTVHHAPHGYHADLTSAELNRPLSELDAAIETVITTGSGVSTTLTAQAGAGQASLTVASSAGFAPGDPIYIGTGAMFEPRIVNTVPGGGVTVTVTVNLTNTYASGKPVSKSPVEIVDARGGFTTIGGRIGALAARGRFDVRDYDPLPGPVDNHAALQACLTDAFNAPGGTMIVPLGEWLSSAPLVTPANTAGAVTIRGEGRPKHQIGGVNGDPSAPQGSQITYTGNTGDIFLASMVSGANRQYITIENLALQGNPSGASGSGLHFYAPDESTALLVCLRDVTVVGTKDHGIWFDGNVFESQLFNVRSVAHGGCGFKAGENSGGIPGEVRIFGSSFIASLRGMELSGGGNWNLFGVTITNNADLGFSATGVVLSCFGLHMEVNGAVSNGTQAYFSGLFGATFANVVVTAKVGGTGRALAFSDCYWNHIYGFNSNSATAGAGYKDITFDNTCSRCSVDDYSGELGVDRIDFGTHGDNTARRGVEWMVPVFAVTGSRGSNAALASLLTGLAAMGLITNSSS